MSIKLIALFITLLFISIVGYIESNFTALSSTANFEPIPLTSHNFFIYDIGVTDIDDDGQLDIFTSNHFARNNILLNNNLSFIDYLSKTQLYQEAAFPEIEDVNYTANVNKDGLYIYWDKTLLVFQAKGVNQYAGSITANEKITIQSDNVDASKITNKNKNKLTTTVHFKSLSNNTLVIDPYLIAIPISITLGKDIDLSKVYVGPRHINPQTNSFSIFLNDRHGINLADLNKDGKRDLFIVRGGLKGLIPNLTDPDIIKDELYLNVSNGYKNIIEQTAMLKGDCSGHQSTFVDYNNDDLLDIYINCRRLNQENQFYIQQDNLTFIDKAEDLGLNLSGKWLGAFIWLDYNNDLNQDLLIEEERNLYLYTNTGNGFVKKLLTKLEGTITKFTATDFDIDGDIDIYAASKKQSILLINKKTMIEVQNPNAYQLPTTALYASWVDYDNDGRADLHTVPHGIFRQQENGGFTETTLFRNKFKMSTIKAITNWADLNNDGFRDLVFAVKYNKPYLETYTAKLLGKDHFHRNWQVKLYKNNQRPLNNWLTIKLAGNAGNKDAIGAKVLLENDNYKMLQQVGHAEGSHASQGHYLLYFGLNNLSHVKKITIYWNSGKITKLSNIKANQLLAINIDN